MELAAFTTALSRLSQPDVRRVASSLAAHSDSAAGEVDAWRATLGIDRALRRCHRSRDAAHAALAATHAVQGAAAADGVALPDHDVTLVARAAAEIARGIVAGELAEDDVRMLLKHFGPLLAISG
jgi:hypothetical protein